MKTVAALALLSASALVSATPAPLVSRADPPEGVDDTVILNYALTLEHLENAFYSGALEQFDAQAFTDAGLPAQARPLFEQIGKHEQAHVDFLSTALADKATKPCSYKFPYTNPKEFAAVSMILEGVGVSAYLGAAQYITNPAYLTAAASVLTTEARHASWVSSAGNNVEPWSGGLDVPLDFNQVYSLAAGFITGCPDSNPALPVQAFPTVSFSPTTAQPGDEVTLSVPNMQIENGAVGFFLTGLGSENATVQDSKITIPKDLAGTVYFILAKSGADKVADDSTTAGPAVFQFEKPIAANSQSNSVSGSQSADSSMSTDAATGLYSSSTLSMILVPVIVAVFAMLS